MSIEELQNRVFKHINYLCFYVRFVKDADLYETGLIDFERNRHLFTDDGIVLDESPNDVFMGVIPIGEEISFRELLDREIRKGILIDGHKEWSQEEYELVDPDKFSRSTGVKL